MGKISINQDSLKERREWKRHKINDGSNIFRVLPPFGETDVHNGYPYRKWSYVWLHDPATGKRKPFASPFSTGGDKCPVKDYADALAKKVDGIEANMKAQGKSTDEVKKRLEKVRSVQWKLKLTHGYLYNACDKGGEVGILELKATAHKDMCKRMQEYIKTYAQDPTSLSSFDDDSGVWFDIQREGVGKNTVYSVAFNQTTEKDDKGRLAKFDDRTPLPENVVENYDDIGYDLSTVYTVKGYNELKAILDANVLALATDDSDPIPDLIVEGLSDSEPVQTPPSQEEEPVIQKSGPTQGKKPVKLKLDVNDDVATDSGNAGVSATDVDDDFFKMADNILND